MFDFDMFGMGICMTMLHLGGVAHDISMHKCSFCISKCYSVTFNGVEGH